MNGRLGYANVVSTLIVFLALAGGAAYAASHLGKSSVGTKQLKKNAVTTAKIKKGAVTTAKIKDGAVNGVKVADASLTGADVDVASTTFSRVTARISAANHVLMAPASSSPIGSYTQPAGEDDQYVGWIDVTFTAGCTAPRSATVLLILDAANPAVPAAGDIAGSAIVEDGGAGTVTRRAQLGPYIGLSTSLSRLAPVAPTPHTFSVYPIGVSCATGGGIELTDSGIEVIGTR